MLNTIYDNPEVTFFLVLIGVVNIVLLYMIIRSIIIANSKDSEASNKTLDKVVELLGKQQTENERTRVVIDNNTVALNANVQLSQELLSAGRTMGSRLDEAVAKIMNGLNQLSNSIRELEQNRKVEHKDLADVLQSMSVRLKSLSEELNNGSSRNENTDTAGSRSTSPGNQ